MRPPLAILGLIAATHLACGQDALDPNALATAPTSGARAGSAWLDLRQNVKAGSVQSAPEWVEAVTLIPADPKSPSAQTLFRIRVQRPDNVSPVLYFRLFFNDQPAARPEVTAWDETGSQLIRSGPLGSGIELESSDAILIPMHTVSSIDVAVPGDGTTVRGAYLEWMTSSELVHPAKAGAQDAVPQPFAATNALHAGAADDAQFGTVTAPLASDPIRIGPMAEEAATFAFPLEAQPLLALLTFEIAGPRIDSPPEIMVNGQNVGPVQLSLPDLADPGYRGEVQSLVNGMQFQYTGWLRAQKILPVSLLKAGDNNIAVTNGVNATAAVVRATQLQLKYLWDKSDYILKPER